jgi:hypothetical protein
MNDVLPIIIQKLHKQMMNNDPILSQIGLEKTIHSGRYRYEHNEKELITESTEFSSPLNVNLDEIREFDIQGLCGKLYLMVEDMMGQIHKSFYSSLNTISEHTGNTVDAKGEKLTIDTIISIMDKMPAAVDEEGKLVKHTLVMSPKMEKEFAKLVPTDTQLARMKEIEDRKMEEYLAQKRTRRLSRINY